MKTLEVRRHTMRKKPADHLSQEGIDLANLVGKSLKSFDFVVTSTLPRAIETSKAMGYAVDEMWGELGHLPKEVLEKISWPQSFKGIAETIAREETVQVFAQFQANLWRRVLDQLSSSQHGLIITHGGIIELGAIGIQPTAQHSEWGRALGYCEGVRITCDGENRECKILRVPEKYRLIEN